MTIRQGQVYIGKHEDIKILRYTGHVSIIQGVGGDLSVIDTSGDMDGERIPRMKMFGEGGLYKSEENFLKSHRLATREEAEAAMYAWEVVIKNRQTLINFARQHNVDSELAKIAAES